MLEMVFSVVSLNEGFNGKEDKGNACSLTRSTVYSTFSLLCHEFCKQAFILTSLDKSLATHFPALCACVHVSRKIAKNVAYN